MTIPVETLSIRQPTSDSFPLALTISRPRSPSAVIATVVFVNATGVQARFYHAFAAWLATQRIAAYTFDYRYSGASFPPSLDIARMRTDDDYRDATLRTCPHTVELTSTWCRLDLAAVVELAFQSYPSVPLVTIGHSLGGHLQLLLPPTHVYGPNARIARFLNVCGGNAYYGNHARPDESEFGFVEMVLKPLVDEGIFRASNLGLGFDLPQGPGFEWSAWFFHPHFAYNRPADMDRARSLTGVELLYIGFEDDDRISKRMMYQFMNMLDHSDGLKRSLWLDPATRSPRWPRCGHVNAFTRSKASEAVPVEHGQAYAPKFDDAAAASGGQAESLASSEEREPSRLKREETIWILMRDYILGRELDVSEGDEVKVWTRRDERDVEAERREEEQKRSARPSRVEIVQALLREERASDEGRQKAESAKL